MNETKALILTITYELSKRAKLRALDTLFLCI